MRAWPIVAWRFAPTSVMCPVPRRANNSTVVSAALLPRSRGHIRGAAIGAPVSQVWHGQRPRYRV
jgi:hypothetical protein